MLILTLAIALSCSNTNFKSMREAGSSLSEGGYSDDVTSGKYSIKSSVMGQEIEVEGEVYNKPASILFLLDRTGSMSSQINTVKNNINAFVDNLSSLDFKVKVGLVAFEDTITNTADLSSDLTAFKSTMNAIYARGGGDAQEFALGAIEAAIDMFSEQETNSDALRVIVLVTDNAGHREPIYKTSGSRNCAIETTTAKFNSIKTSLHKNIKFFSSAPASSTACSSYTASTQMTAILSQILPSVPQDKRGSPIAWPFDSVTFSTILPTMIKEVTPSSRAICLADKITFEVNGIDVVYKSSFEKEYTKFKNDTPLSFKNNIGSTTVPDDLLNEEQSLEITQKCFSYDDAEKGDFTNPIKSVETELQYTVMKNI